MTGRVRDRILALIAEHGVLRMSQVMKLTGLPAGSVSGHLTWLVRNGCLARPARGVYALPSRPVTSLPAPLPHNVSKRNTTVWESMTAEQRQRRIDAMAAGRTAAARRRLADSRLPQDPRRTLTASQVARELGLAPQTIQHHAALGRLPSDEIPGGHRRYNLDEARAALAPYRRAPRRKRGAS